MTSRVVRGVVALLLLSLLAIGLTIWRGYGDEPMDGQAGQPMTSPSPMAQQQVERGAYLARAGNCAGCHTARGGAPYAGGAGIATPFGMVYAGNLTPDLQSGLGRWSARDFWRALHFGRSRDGGLLYPVFPYTSYSAVSRDDSDALYAYLRSLKPVNQPNMPHALEFPYRSQIALALWRGLFFKPAVFTPDPLKPAQWNRGAYLVRGLGHCGQCHAERNALGALKAPDELGGGMIAMQHWYAPSLASRREAGLARDDAQQFVRLLKTGIADARTAMGPMADVVYRSTQYLNPTDLEAIAQYLIELPATDAPLNTPAPPDALDLSSGKAIYRDHCARCHGLQGEGAPGAYAPLAGNRAVTLGTPANLVQTVLHGGYAPATAGNPRPYGMPPYRQTLNDTQIADVLTFIRRAWGNGASPVSPLEVMQHQ